MKDINGAYSDPEQFVIEALENLAEQAELHDDETQFVPPCIEPGVYGVHFIDSLFGAHTVQDDTVVAHDD